MKEFPSRQDILSHSFNNRKKKGSPLKRPRGSNSLSQTRTFQLLLGGISLTFLMAILTEVPNPKSFLVRRPQQPRPSRNLMIQIQIDSRGVVAPPALEQFDGQPDYGNLNIEFWSFSSTSSWKRIIWDSTHGPGPIYEDVDHDGYAQDDDVLKNTYLSWYEELGKNRTCRIPEKHVRLHFPTCNLLHEHEFESNIRSGSSRKLGAGLFHLVFVADPSYGDRLVMKSGNLERDLTTFNYIEQYLMDGKVSAAILPHPLYVDLYAFCFVGMLGEYMGGGDMEQLSLINEYRCKPTPILLSPEVSPQKPLAFGNNFSATQKLQFSLDMAEALALMHNHPGGVLIHDDIQLSQFLLAPNGRVKFNDFNRAEIMQFDQQHNQYCKYYNGRGHGDWRSPEEYNDDPLDEYMDVFSLANNFYSILTGFYPFPHICSDHQAAKQVVAGKRSYLDPRWKQKSFGEGRLSQLIQQCWAESPNDRPSIGEVVVFLRSTLLDHERLEHENKPQPE